MLLATASVAQLAEHRTRFARSRVRFPARWPKVAFYATGPGCVLKNIYALEIFLLEKLSLTIPVYIRENKVSVKQDISPVCWRVN